MELLVKVEKVNEARYFTSRNQRGETKDIKVLSLQLGTTRQSCSLNADALGEAAERMLNEKIQPGDVLNIDLRFNARSFDTENGKHYVTDCCIYDYFKVNQGVEAF